MYRCALRAQAARRGACALAVLCACAALAANADGDKRAEMSPVPFVLGSRYGRSPPRLLAPRNDRFFMGSRYGKRSQPESMPPPAPPQLATLMGSGEGPRGLAPPGLAPLVCDYTGLLALYHCRPARLPLLDNRRNDLDPNISDED